MSKNHWSILRVSYLVVVYLAGAIATASMAVNSVEPAWGPFIILLVMAFATEPLRVGLPRVDRTVSLSFLFTFAAITELPAASAIYIAAVAEAHSLLAERPERLTWANISFRFATLAVCVFATSVCYQQLAEQIEGPFRAAAAGLTYYAVSSLLSALLMAIEEQISVARIWNERFFWSGPVYLLASVGLSVAQRLTSATTPQESILALVLIFGPYLYLRQYWARLHDHEDQVRGVADTRHRAIEMLAAAIESKDGGSAAQLRRLRRSAVNLAEEVGCTEGEREALEQAALLHDIGKVGVPDYILTKPAQLTEHEFSQVATHSSVGAAIADSAQFPESVGDIIRCHHEHWDGSGYPAGLTGEAIPRLARILTIVDCFDALTSERPYRPALSMEEAVATLKEQRGKMLDPNLLDTFLNLLPQMVADRGIEENRPSGEPAPVAPDRVPVKQTWASEAVKHAAALQHESLAKLARTPDQLWAFYEILDVLGADLEFEKSLQKCLTILYRPIPYHKAGVFVLENGHFLLLAAQGFPEHCVSRLALSQEHGLIAQALTSRSAIAGNAPPSELPSGVVPRYLTDVKSSLVAPLIVEERVVGLIVLCGKKKNEFTQEQAYSLRLIAPKLARTLMSSRAVQRISVEAETDAVTGLSNARAAFRRLEIEMNRAQRNRSTVGVLFMDVDGLKPVNDNYGHRAGDELLIAVARRLNGRLRAYDFAARVGGDEFMAILPGVSREDLATASDSMRSAVADAGVKVADDTYARVTISIGSAMYPYDGLDADDLVNLSDQRMYEAKIQARIPSRNGEASSQPTSPAADTDPSAPG